jgi:uncharacterized protein (TIGR01777 family)
MAMKILITGATGLIGSEIMRQCSALKVPVHFLTTSKLKLNHDPLAHGFLWNPALNEIDLNAFEGITHIINLAGVTIAGRWTSSYKTKILQSRLESISTLKRGIEALDSHQIEYFVGASAIGIYPSSFNTTYRTNEDKNTDRILGTSFLRDTVIAWEKANMSMSELGIAVGQLRVGLVMDATQGALPEFVAPIKKYVGAPFGTGNQWQSWVHIKDIAAMFLFLVNHKSDGIFNGVAPTPIRQSELVKIIATHFNKPLWLPNVPAFVMKFILGEMSALLFESQLVSTSFTDFSNFKFQFSNFQPAINDLFPVKEMSKL